MIVRSLFLGVALCGGLAQLAAAHEFDLLLLAPDDATGADLEAMRAAFLIAARERDGHPAETSEGHLGGMDVQLTLASPSAGAGVAGRAYDIVASPFAPADDPRVATLAAPGDSAILDKGSIAALTAGDRPGGDGAGPAPFADRFRAETGGDPGPAAEAAYLAARAIDRALRPLGAVDDRAALRRSFSP